MKNFILLGAAGYVAPRHMKAIKDVGGNLLAIADPHDSVGVIDQHFSNCNYFQDFERLDRYCYKLLTEGIKIDYVSICSPNYLHDAHCRWALRLGADAICEKPLVLSERNLDALINLQKDTGHTVYGVYQLRYHPNFIAMKNAIKEEDNKVEINYSTPRGNWYYFSWKGQVGKSGGVETNIGCHLFDVCTALFGSPQDFRVIDVGAGHSSGVLFFADAQVQYDLSVRGDSPNRVFKINDIPFAFDSGFVDLHTHVYESILSGHSIPIEEYRPSIRICEKIRLERRFPQRI